MDRSKRFIRLASILPVLVVVCLALVSRPLHAATGIRVEFVTLSGATVEQLASGASGSGLLLYYPSNGTPEKPGLVVFLQKASEASVSMARVYDDQTGNGHVDIAWEGGVPTIQEPNGPTIIMTALDGWWVRDGSANYNLDVEILGQVCAMWGAGPDCGGRGYIDYLRPGELSFDIRVRDPDHLGVPQWELRSLVPSFPGWGTTRMTYAERQCGSPVQSIPSVSPHWPYVAETKSFLQEPGQLRPPIFVDWVKGRITLFAELVAVRGQNCSYNLYSISPLRLGELNSPDFEAPFAFYDLSGEGRGRPNLIIRMGRYPAQDMWLAPHLFWPNPERSPPVLTIRYSWKNDVGDGTLDYKVDLFGFHPYNDRTPIAGGSAWIDAPPYSELPSWVVGRAWPSATFIDTNGSAYGTSEGIYEWSSDDIGLDYLLGMTDAPDLSPFAEIPLALRGEFRYQHTDQPHLYFSPLDNRLHLLYAEGGLWNLGEGWVLREHNLTGGPYIDGWTLEQVPIESEAELQMTSAHIAQALYALKDYILFADLTDDSTILKEAQYTPSLFSLLPPTDHASWENFRARLEPYEGQGRDPKHLRTWLSALGGQSLEIAGGDVRGVRPEGSGFRFVLELQPTFRVSGTVGPDMTSLQPGAYVVTYNGSFDVQSYSAAHPGIVPGTLRLSSPAPPALEPVEIEAFIHNSGLEDLPNLSVYGYAISSDSVPHLIGESEVDLLAGQSVRVRLHWTPAAPGEWQITLTWGKEDAQPSLAPVRDDATLNVQVTAQPQLDAATVWELSNAGQPLGLVVFTICVGLAASILTLAALRSSGRSV